MQLFTMKQAHRKHRMSLVAIHPARVNGKPAAGLYFVSCGAYRKSEKTGNLEYQGLALEGDVPVKEFVRWAKRSGFLKWHHNGHVQGIKKPQPAAKQASTAKKTPETKATQKGTAKHERDADKQHADTRNAQAVPGTPSGGR